MTDERRFLVEAGFPVNPALLERLIQEGLVWKSETTEDTYLFRADGGVTASTAVMACNVVQAIMRATPALYGLLSNLDSRPDFRGLRPYMITVYDCEQWANFWRGDHLGVEVG